MFGSISSKSKKPDHLILFMIRVVLIKFTIVIVIQNC